MSVLSFDTRLLSGLPHVAGISDLEIRATASGTFLYSVSELDSGLGVYRLDGPTPILIDSLAYSPGSGTLGAAGLLPGSISGRDFLLPAGRFDDRAVIHETSTSGQFLTSVAAPSSGSSEADWAESATAVFGGDTFVFAHRRGHTGVEAFRLNSDLSMTQMGGAQPPALSGMAEVSALVTLQRDETAFLIAASALDSSLGVFALGSEGSLTEVHRMEPGAGLPINTPINAEVTSIGDNDYLFMGSFGTSSL